MENKLFFRIHPKVVLPIAGFILLSGVYYYWAWSHVLADFGGDNAIYLLTAQYFSPWHAYSNISAYFFAKSLYPPFYPFVLAVFGGSESLLVAHLVTVTCLLLAFIAAYIWLRTQNVTSLVSGLLILLFALMPGTYIQALKILSENLYLLLTLACLGAVAAHENDRRAIWLWIAAGSLVAATLTRSAGIALLAAFLLYLFLHRPPNLLRLVVVTTAPMIVWNIFSGQESHGYFASFIEKYKAEPVNMFLQGLAHGSHVIWIGWVKNFAGSSIAKPLTGFLGVLCLIGMSHRIYLRKLDGFYSASYLLLILVWPFPAEVQRFLFVITPVLLVQGVLLLERFPRVRVASLDVRPIYILFVALFIIVIPDLALTTKRFISPIPEEYADYRRSSGWYYIDPNEARMNVAMNKALVAHMQSLRSNIPEGECIYSIKPSIVGYYSGRISLIPPRPYLDKAAFDVYLNNTNCRYFYLMGFISPSFSEMYYPLARMHESLKIISLAQASDDKSLPFGILAEWEGR